MTENQTTDNPCVTRLDSNAELASRRLREAEAEIVLLQREIEQRANEAQIKLSQAEIEVNRLRAELAARPMPEVRYVGVRPRSEWPSGEAVRSRWYQTHTDNNDRACEMAMLLDWLAEQILIPVDSPDVTPGRITLGPPRVKCECGAWVLLPACPSDVPGVPDGADLLTVFLAESDEDDCAAMDRVRDRVLAAVAPAVQRLVQIASEAPWCSEPVIVSTQQRKRADDLRRACADPTIQALCGVEVEQQPASSPVAHGPTEWTIGRRDDKTWTIDDPSGQSRGSWNGAESMVTHLAFAFQEMDELRGQIADLRNQLDRQNGEHARELANVRDAVLAAVAPSVKRLIEAVVLLPYPLVTSHDECECDYCERARSNAERVYGPIRRALADPTIQYLCGSGGR